MAIVYLLLLIAAVVCFVIAAVGKPSKVNLVALGLAFFAGTFALQMLLRVAD